MTAPTLTAFPTQFNHVVAFEVSKETLVVHTLPADEQKTVANSLAAVRRLLRFESKRNSRKNLGRLLVVCEATGGYERHILDAAIEIGLSVHRAHGSRVRFFARYLGKAAKTDQIDARVLADFGRQAKDLRLYVPPPQCCETLKALHGRRSELQAMMLAETNRIEHAINKVVQTCIEAHVQALKAALKAIEAEIAKLVDDNQDLKTKTQLMCTVVGVGMTTASTLLAYLPELGTMTKGQVARKTGLAPINNDSGKKVGRRHIEPGRTSIKRCLFMAAGVAMRLNPILKTFADRLRANGHPFKYVVTAVMRKLVVILNAVLRDGHPSKGLIAA